MTELRVHPGHLDAIGTHRDRAINAADRATAFRTADRGTAPRRGGSASLSAAAADLTAHVAELAQTQALLISAAIDMDGTWDSGAEHAAIARIRDVAAWHDRHAEHTRTAAKVAAAQANNFDQARTTIPHPDEFPAVERRLCAAASANAVPPAGRCIVVIAGLQQQLAHLSQ